MAVRVIEEIAERFSADLQGIPWADFEQKFKMPKEEIVVSYATTETGITASEPMLEYLRVISASMQRAKDVVETLNMSWTMSTPRAKQAWEDVKKGMIPVSQAALESFKKDFYALLPMGTGVEVNVEDLRATVSSIYLTALYGAQVQMDLLMQKAGRSPSDIVEHAQLVAQSFNIITFFNEHKLLDSIKKAEFKPNPAEKTNFQGWVENVITSPLGEAFSAGAIIAIVVVAVALIAGICWTMVAMRKISATNKALLDVCEQAASTGDADAMAACAKLSEMNQVATDNGPSFGMNQITKWLLLGAAGYMLFLFGPAIAATIERRIARQERKALSV